MRKPFLFLMLLISFSIQASVLHELSNKDKVKFFLQNFNSTQLNLIEDFYRSDAVLSDPIAEIKGAKELKNHYSHIYKDIKSVDIKFEDIIETAENRIIMVYWTAQVTSDKLNEGKPIQVRGHSMVKFDLIGKASHHHNYFDMGQLVYENVKYLNYFTRKVKKKFTPN